MHKSMNNNTKFDRDFKYQLANISISIPDVDCNMLGKHFACFLRDKEWCEKRALLYRMEWL